MKQAPSYIHPFFWLWLPLIYMAAQIVFEIVVPRDVKIPMLTEGGPVETLQEISLLCAFFIAVWALFKINWSTQKWIGLWFALAAACCFYVGGEEISWGQHLVNWTTPEYWSQYNDQNETNLHNTSSWLDQKPRAILMVGIVIGGLIIPALRRWKSDWVPAKFNEIYPSGYLSLIALLVIVPYLVQNNYNLFTGKNLFERVSEVQELCMYYFVTLYLFELRKRVISQV
jgi:hypothetical protein